MLTITDSPRHAGIIIRGPDDDFEELYEACHYLLSIRDGNEGREADENWLSIRMLSLCYDLRHKMQAIVEKETDYDPDKPAQPEKSISPRMLAFPGYAIPEDSKDEKNEATQTEGDDKIFKDEGIYDDDMIFDSEVSEVRIVWPETIFAAFMLNHYLAIPFFVRREKKYKDIDQTVQWTVVRKFQLQIIDCLCASAPPTKAKGIRTLFHDEYKQFFADYCTLFIEKMTVDFLGCNPEKRLREIGLMPSRIINKTGNYYAFEDLAKEESRQSGRPPWELHLSEEYPEEIDW